MVKTKKSNKESKGLLGNVFFFNSLYTVNVFASFAVTKKKEEEKKDEDGDETDSNATKTCENLVNSSLPPVDRKQQRIAELQKMKANCKSEDLEQLKTRCEILIRNCIVGLLAQLSDEDFKNMEGMVL